MSSTPEASSRASARRGYGYACLAGADVCRQRGAGVVVFMEADGTDDPRDLRRLVGPVLAGHVDLMVGSRREAVRRKGGMPAHQRWGNALAVVCLRALFGVRLPDNGPFRAVRADLLAELAMEPSAYAWTTEMVIKAARAGARVEWVETAYRDRRGESKIAGSVRGYVGGVRRHIRDDAAAEAPARWARTRALTRAPARGFVWSVEREARVGVPAREARVDSPGASGLPDPHDGEDRQHEQERARPVAVAEGGQQEVDGEAGRHQ